MYWEGWPEKARSPTKTKQQVVKQDGTRNSYILPGIAAPGILGMHTTRTVQVSKEFEASASKIHSKVWFLEPEASHNPDGASIQRSRFLIPKSIQRLGFWSQKPFQNKV